MRDVSASVHRWNAVLKELGQRSPLFRLGLPLFAGGAIDGLFAYVNWSFLTSAYANECTGEVLASSCGSIGSSAGAWAAILAVGAIAMIVGVVLCGLGVIKVRQVRQPVKA